jgi:hypothetical protein
MTRDSDDNAFESKFGKTIVPPQSFWKKPFVWLGAGFIALCVLAWLFA